MVNNTYFKVFTECFLRSGTSPQNRKNFAINQNAQLDMICKTLQTNMNWLESGSGYAPRPTCYVYFSLYVWMKRLSLSNGKRKISTFTWSLQNPSLKAFIVFTRKMSILFILSPWFGWVAHSQSKFGTSIDWDQLKHIFIYK